MNEYPLLCNTQVVQNILAGRQTQDRRPIRPQPKWVADPGIPFKTDDADPQGIINNPPHYKPGDLLYVRETFCNGTFDVQRDGYSEKTFIHQGNLSTNVFFKTYNDGIWLRVKKVWIERVQDISEADAKAEGVEYDINPTWPQGKEYKNNFKDLWNSIYGKTEHSWGNNPWVRCCEFERIEKQNDKLK